MKEIYSPHLPTVERVNHILNERTKRWFFFSMIELRSGVKPFEYGVEDEIESSNPLLELYRRCLESISFNDELKNFAKAEIVEMYEEK